MTAAVISCWEASKRRSTRLGNCTICGVYDIMRRTWCSKHYQRWIKHGDPNIVHAKSHGALAKNPFTIVMWARWLVEFNSRTREPSTEFRRLLAARGPKL